MNSETPLRDQGERIAHLRAALLAGRPSQLSDHTTDRLCELGVGNRLPCSRCRHNKKQKQIGPQPIPVLLTHPPCPFAAPLSPPLPTLYPSQSPVFKGNRHKCRTLIKIPLTASTSSYGLKTAHFNAQSVRPSFKQNRTEITNYIAEEDIDIFFITETWLKLRGNEPICADLTPSDYLMKSFLRSATRKLEKRGGGGGVAIIFKDKFAPNITFRSTFDFNHESFELAQMSLTSRKEVIDFLCIYCSGPKSANKNKLTDSLFLDQFPELLDYCNVLHGKLCILGDLNFHVKNPNNRSASRLKDLLVMYNLEQTVSGPNHRCGHTLDLVIVRPLDAIHRSTEVTKALKSDRFCVVVAFDINLSPLSPVYCNTRNIRGIDRDAFRGDVQAELSGTGQLCTANQFNAALRGVLDQHAPLTRRKVTQRRDPSPWFSVLGDELIAAKQARRTEERRKDSTGLTVHLQMYKKAKNFVTFLVQKAKTIY